MNISTADFDWISLLFLVGAGVIGLMKSGAKKVHPRPVVVETSDYPDFAEEGEDEEQGYIVEEAVPVYRNEEQVFQPRVGESSVVSDYYRNPKTDSLFRDQPDEITENQETVAFDLRQAIISMEILKRPEF